MARGIMEVMILKAKGLGDTDFIGDMDPYVLIQYKGQEHKTSVAGGQGGAPEWNEKFNFRAEYPGSGQDYSITLMIHDKDTFSSDDFIGKATIYVEELLSLGAEKGSSEIHPRKYSVVHSDNSYRGEIQVSVKFTNNNNNTNMVEEQRGGHNFGGWKERSF